jgi:hypothetical protein
VDVGLLISAVVPHCKERTYFLALRSAHDYSPEPSVAFQVL